MKFRCEQETLATAVATAQRAVASRTGAPPVLSDLRITATADGIELVGSDLEITSRVHAAADVEETGVAVIPKIIGEIVRKLEGSVTIAVVDEEATISSGSFTTTLRLKQAEEYPRIAASDGAGVAIDAATFAGALRQVVRAASRDDLRPILTGVLLTTTASGLRLVATDSYRLAVRDLPGITMLGDRQKVLVAAKGLAEVQRLAEAKEKDGSIDTVEVVLGERDVVFRRGNSEVTARLIEGEFPNYEQLIPAGYPNRLTVNKAAFREAVERVMVVGQGRDNAAVRLTMRSDGLELAMTAQDIGSSTGSIDAKYEGTELVVAFNPQFLLDGIDVVDGAELALETVDNLKPATLRSAVRPDDGGDFLYLLMPVRTS